MALKDRKITEAGIAQHGVISAPDRLTGTAAENKKVFDKLVRNVVAEQLNGLVDDLAGSGGASEIGASPISGLSGENVQEVLVAMKAVLDKRIAEAGVASFKGRSGLVVPESGDYTAAMVGAAPAGYGLGGNAPVVVDCNEVWQNGFYQTVGSTVNCPPKIPNAQYASLLVYNRTSNYVWQELTRESYKARRSGNYSTGEWGEWEYENPPMELGVEYRTTERHGDGKPVYIRYIDLANLPSNGSKDYSVAETGIPTDIVSYTIKYSSAVDGLGSLDSASWAALTFFLSDNKLRVATTKALSGYFGTAVIKYTKD